MNLSVSLAGISLSNPLMPASGPLTKNPSLCRQVAEQGVAAIVTKTISVKAAVVPKPNIFKLPDGVFNCETWSEKDPRVWIEEYFPQIRELGLPVILSLGYQPEDLVQLIPQIDQFADAYAPSVHYLGNAPEMVHQVSKAAKSVTTKPVFIKLSPHVPDLVGFAEAAVEGGADGLIAINSVGPAYSIDIKTRRSPLGSSSGYGWLSGQAIKPIALHAVHELAQAVNVPVIGVGGISSAEDVVEFMMAGATAVQMLSGAILYGLDLFGKILSELPRVLKEIGEEDIKNIIGAAA